MKLVDSNGKIFKKFNIIDVIVIILVLAIVIALAWKTIADNRPVVAQSEEDAKILFENADHLIYSVVCQDVPEEVAEEFQAQMKLPRAECCLMSNGEPLEGYITGCTYETGENGLCKVRFTIEAVLEETDGIYSVGSQEIRIGKSHIVKTYKIETVGVIYSMEVSKNG